MEIERKWMVKGWPEGLPLREEFAMRQGYISVRPTVRIRAERTTSSASNPGAALPVRRSSAASTKNCLMIWNTRLSLNLSSRSCAAATPCRTVLCWK